MEMWYQKISMGNFKEGGCIDGVTNSRSGFTLALFKVCLGELNKPIYSEVRTDQRQNNKWKLKVSFK